MADPIQCIDFVMRQEDSHLSGVITNKPTDRGGCTRFGLTARWHPELVEQGFYEFELVDGKQSPKIPTAHALTIAEQAYEAQYSEALRLSDFNSTAVATALLSLSVVEGQGEAVAMLKKAVVAVTHPAPALKIDGTLNEQTVTLANAADPAKLRDTMAEFAAAHFEHIAQVIPGQSANLKGWLSRASALRAIAAPDAGEVQKEEAAS